MHSPIKAQTTFRNPIAVSLLVLGLAATSTIHAQGELTVEERVGRLETVAGAEALVELLRQAQQLEREVRELRGELEVQAARAVTAETATTRALSGYRPARERAGNGKTGAGNRAHFHAGCEPGDRGGGPG